MINYSKPRGSTSRFAPLYGDGEILLTILSMKNWNNLFNKKNNFIMIAFSAFLRIKLSMFTYASSAIFRYKFGTRTTGFFLSIMTLLVLIGLNSTKVHFILKPIFPFFSPFGIPFVTTQFWQPFLLEQIHSQGLFYYSCTYTIAALFHTLCIYLGFGNKNDPTKRGNSYLYEAFFKHTRISEFTIQAIIEPIILLIAAYCTWYFMEDKLLAVLLLLSGLSMFIQEAIDKANQTRLRVPK